jgi:tRNA-dihydrouridine synthase B
VRITVIESGYLLRGNKQPLYIRKLEVNMKIGNVEINGRLCLAPMAGVTDRAFRAVCKEFGADYMVTEMASAKAMVLSDKKTARLCALRDEEHPVGIQLFGDEPGTMARAAKLALEYKPDILDINMGCPAPKVTGNGGGSALLRSPALVSQIVRSIVKASSVPVTCKIRLGYDKDHINAVEIAKRIEEAGAAAVCVHGRTREQMYRPGVDYGAIAAVREAVSIPVIANGDILTPQDAKHVLDETGCELLMIGRGALGAPYLFRQIKEYLATGEVSYQPSLSERMEILLRHIALLCEDKGERTGMREARKHVAWYLKGLRGAAHFRNKAGTLCTFDECKALVEEILETNPQVQRY